MTTTSDSAVAGAATPAVVKRGRKAVPPVKAYFFEGSISADGKSFTSTGKHFESEPEALKSSSETGNTYLKIEWRRHDTSWKGTVGTIISAPVSQPVSAPDAENTGTDAREPKADAAAAGARAGSAPARK